MVSYTVHQIGHRITTLFSRLMADIMKEDVVIALNNFPKHFERNIFSIKCFREQLTKFIRTPESFWEKSCMFGCSLGQLVEDSTFNPTVQFI